MGSSHLMAFSRPKRPRRVRYVVGILATLFVIFTFWDGLFGASHSRIQYEGFSRRQSNQLSQPERQRAVKKEFLHAWYGYKDHSWMADSLGSLTGKRKDQFCGWSATLIDALDTLWIMGLKEEYDEAVNATLSIDFAHTAESCQINFFESTIRYLGGLLAAYDLSGDQRLIPKLIELGDILYGQTHTKNGMPCSWCHLIAQNDTTEEPNSYAPLADVGSFSLEFGRLSQITGDKKYAKLVTLMTDVLESTQNSSTIPGLWPEHVNAASVTNGSSVVFSKMSHVYSLGALSDSAYEYLVKTHLLLGGITDRYATMWSKAIDAIRDNLLFRAYIPDWNTTDVLFSGSATLYPESEGVSLEPRIQHLGCFAGGMFAMSARIFNNASDLEIGEQLTKGCIWAYKTSPTGIMPETVTLASCPDVGGPQCAWNQTAWDDQASVQAAWGSKDYPPGYLQAMDTRYILRPEAIESVFILYRITGDEYYREAGWQMFQNIIAQTRTSYGHAALKDVMHTTKQSIYQNGQIVLKEQATQEDDMESFWLAETLKYFWLLFSEPDLISLDDWVLNTEAHPLRLTRGSRGF